MVGGNSALPQRNGYGTVEAIDPVTGKKRPVFVSLQFTEKIARDGIGKAKEFAHIILPLLLTPHAVFRGLRLDHPEIDEDDWFCYVATPKGAYDYKRHALRTPWLGQVVIIPVTSEWVVYNWCWVKCAPEDDRLPIDFQTRFKERVL